MGDLITFILVGNIVYRHVDYLLVRLTLGTA